MEKLFIYDLETTGVISTRHGIHQLSALILINGEVKEEINLHLKPFEKDLIEDEALKVGNITLEDLKTEKYKLPTDGYTDLINILSKYVDRYNPKDKLHLVGYNNASFDNSFFRAFFQKNNDKYFGSWFWADSIDVMVLSSYFLRKERSQLENFKLKTVAQYLGLKIEEEKLHNAIYDLYLTHEILKKVTN